MINKKKLLIVAGLILSGIVASSLFYSNKQVFENKLGAGDGTIGQLDVFKVANGYIESRLSAGYDLLLKGSNRYLNFGSISGSTGYGFRDNAGSMEFKNSAGAWTGIGSGGSSATTTWGSITGTLSSQTDLQNSLNSKLSTTTAASTYTPQSRSLSINGTSYDLSADRSWTLSGSATTTINGTNGPNFTFSTGTTGNDFNLATSTGTVTLNIPTASSTTRGLLSSVDWSTFNNKLSSLNGALLLDQTSPQSIINGIPLLPKTLADFTNSSQIVNKEYVDSVLSFKETYFFNNTASSIGGIYYKMLDTPTGEAEATFVSGSLAVGDGQSLVDFATDAGAPGTTVIKSGIYMGHIHASKASAVGRTAKIYYEIYNRTTGGTETLIATSETSDFLVTTKESYELHATVVADVMVNSTDRRIIKWKTNVAGAGTDAIVTLYVEGTNASSLTLPTTTEVLSSVFLRQDGTKALTGNWNAGTYSITASNLSGTNTGDSATNSTSNTYADGKVADAINDGTTTIAPSQNVVFDALALKAPLTSPTFATSINGSYLTASQLLGTDASKNIVSLPVATYPSLTELTYLKGVTSAIQTQLNGKQATLTNPITGTGTINEIAYFPTASTVGSLAVATYPSLTELSYVKGVTSAIQTQLNNKISSQWTTSGSNINYVTGNVSIGTTSATYPLNIVSSGQTGIYTQGNFNGFFQNNIQNINTGVSASSDWVATANNGNDSIHYIDMGINGSGGGATPFTGANQSYLYSANDDLNIGALNSTSTINFFTATSSVAKMSLNSSGNLNVTGTITGSNLSGTNTGNESTTTIGTLINGSTATTSPADADKVAIWGSVTSKLQSITWANVKASLKTYFDTVYAQLAGSVSQAFSALTLDLGNTDTTLARVSAGVVSVEGVTVPTISSTNTLTNKRINSRIISAASYTTDTGTSLDVSTADEFVVTAQAGALKFNNPSGTPTEGQKLIIRVKDNGTARALTYDTQFRASSDLALPTTTVLSKTLYMGFIWNNTDTKWDLVALLNNF